MIDILNMIFYFSKKDIFQNLSKKRRYHLEDSVKKKKRTSLDDVAIKLILFFPYKKDLILFVNKIYLLDDVAIRFDYYFNYYKIKTKVTYVIHLNCIKLLITFVPNNKKLYLLCL